MPVTLTPEDLTLSPPASFTSPLSSGPSFLSGLLGGAASAFNPLSSLAAIAGPLFGGPDAALQPDVNTVDGRQSLGLQFSSPFQVGGEGNTLDASPRLDVSPVDSTKTASAGSSVGMDNNTLLLIGAAVVGGLLLLFGFRRS